MKATFFIPLFVLLSFSLVAQDSIVESVYFEGSFEFTSQFNKEGAALDLDNNNLRILFPGGFGGMPDFDNEEDISFQKKYSVKFHSQGCIRFEGENEKEYNLTIFAYLDDKYGEVWREEIRDDAIGFSIFPPK